jgi:hypothetical protein
LKVLKPRRDKDEDELLRQSAPLSSFAGRIATTYRLGLISQDDADAFAILPKIRKTEETVGYSDTDRPKGSETVTAKPTSTAPDLDSTRSQGLRNGLTGSFGVRGRAGRRGPFRGLHRGQLGLELLVLVEDSPAAPGVDKADRPPACGACHTMPPHHPGPILRAAGVCQTGRDLPEPLTREWPNSALTPRGWRRDRLGLAPHSSSPLELRSRVFLRCLFQVAINSGLLSLRRCSGTP